MRLSQLKFGRNLVKLMDSSTATKLEQYSKFTPSPVSIWHFLQFGRTASSETSYLFLRKEIPVRLTNMMKELELLPEPLQQQRNCCMIQDHYIQSLVDILKFESAPNTPETRDSFTTCLSNIRQRHKDTVANMAEAVMQMKQQQGVAQDRGLDTCIQYFLDRLYMSRISIHMLINQHTLIFGDDCQRPQDVGCIDPYCDVPALIKDAFSNAAFLCDQYYLQSPNLNLKVVNKSDGGGDTVQFVYVPAHLYHILFELFKNALRATVEEHEDAPSLPDINVMVIKSKNDVTVKISDQGGGIARSLADNMFLYSYTTAPNPSLAAGEMGTTVMAGLGYGLPLSRLYARYFQGDLNLASYDGFGTDATVYLKALTTEANEVLPVFNMMAKQLYTKMQPRSLVADWTDPTANLSQSLVKEAMLRSTGLNKNTGIHNTGDIGATTGETGAASGDTGTNAKAG